ncbi:Helicase IV [Planococcus massiliensis]|uniref:DNA 3'-5' helicase n=1 Tax=Planococcus massiliensis TaxID=1499687 RepID=A0A098EI63_9BACL|nr:UvrD-helicase domain-containing protein [Planococcus massiliensis]CEG21492.1 Helicase IV [Planococcus massiliensis]
MEILIILLMLLVGFGAFKKYQKSKILKQIREEKIKQQIPTALEFLSEIEQLKKEYFTDISREETVRKYANFHDECIKDSANETIKNFINIYTRLDSLVKAWNKEFVEREMIATKIFLSNIDGKSLDLQQRRAVITDEVNNLVLAGAGSGKTLTIAAKVKYLVERKKVDPSEILLLTFTKKAALEMEERIVTKMNIPVESMTFHKLGLRIIKQGRENVPEVSDQLRERILDYFEKDILTNPTLMGKVVHFFSYYINVPKDYEEFDSLGEMYTHYKTANLETLKSKVEKDTKTLKNQRYTIAGEEVKSIEEVIIANFLYLNGIKYEYEKVYPHPSTDPYRKKYRPDFYLPEYDLYLEHFGITETNKAPWLSRIEEKKYLEDMKWKREFHAQNKTVLLETYSYFNKNGMLQKKLEEILKKKGVILRPRNLQEIYKRIYITQKTKDRDFGEIIKLIQTFVGLFKSIDYKPVEFRKIESEIKTREKNGFLKERNLLLLSIIEPIYHYYQKSLTGANEIDFADMINEATEYIENQQVRLTNYNYIIVDEFQDISFARYKLVKALRDQTAAKLICVGDDWQSIYRFAGSDLQLFIDFQKFFGYSQLLRIEKTYRNSQELINIAGKFVMKNKNQFVKKLESPLRLEKPLVMYGYDSDFHRAIKLALDDIINKFGTKSSVMILGRNNFDLEKMKEDVQKAFSVIQNEEKTFIKYKNHPELKIEFLTVHRSKGLEADNVILINLENKAAGFPNKISDDSILHYVLTDSDDFMYAEERRLFYVALTRTKNRTYLIAPQKNTSIFVEELVKEQGIPFQLVTQEETIQNNPQCTHCQTGILVVKENATTKQRFLGCTNYPTCQQSFRDISLITDQVICPSCKGYMTKRKGRYGNFYGCSNYPHCSSSLKIEQVGNNFKSFS